MSRLTMLVLSIILAMVSQIHCHSYDTNRPWEKVNNKLYKLMYAAATWGDAQINCLNNYGTLAVPENEEEFLYLQSMVRKMNYKRIINSDYPFFVVWLGIHNLEDYKVWKNVHGGDIQKSGFGRWCEGNGIISSNPREPHCGALDDTNDGLRDWWCHRRQPYICQKTQK